jgi:phage gp37-like protein
MIDRKTRGKQSKIDLLPKPIKNKLDELLRDNKTSQKSILEVVNLLIENAGLSEDDKLSTSGINRYSSKMETIGHDIRQAREMAEIWVAKLGDQPTGDVSQLLMEMLRTQSFRLLVKANENPDDVLDPKTIGELALGIQRIEKAAMLNMEKAKEIKKAFATAAAEQIDEAAVQVGLTTEGAELIKQKILGIV